MDKEEVVEEVWDIKRIIVGIGTIALVIIAGVFVKEAYFPAVSGESKPTEQSLEEAPRYSISNLNSDVREKIEDLKDQANSLDSSEIATSSPQVQKVINDLKNLQQYPKNQVKEACMNICKQL